MLRIRYSSTYASSYKASEIIYRIYSPLRARATGVTSSYSKIGVRSFGQFRVV